MDSLLVLCTETNVIGAFVFLVAVGMVLYIFNTLPRRYSEASAGPPKERSESAQGLLIGFTLLAIAAALTLVVSAAFRDRDRPPIGTMLMQPSHEVNQH